MYIIMSYYSVFGSIIFLLYTIKVFNDDKVKSENLFKNYIHLKEENLTSQESDWIRGMEEILNNPGRPKFAF